MDEKMPIIDKLKDENEKLDENNDLLKNEINNIKSDMQDMKVEKIKEKLYVVDQFINDKYIPTKEQMKNIQTE